MVELGKLISRSGGDGTFGDGNEIDLQPVDVRLDASNARIGIIDLSGVATADDTYQIRLIGSGATSLASVDGEILDGDADGQAGGDFVSSFIIASATMAFAQTGVNPERDDIPDPEKIYKL